MGCVINLLEFVLCCGGRGEDRGGAKATSTEDVNRPLLPQGVESPRTIKESHDEHMVSCKLPSISPLNDRSIRKSSEKSLASDAGSCLNEDELPEHVGLANHIKVSQDSHKASVSLPLISSVHDRSHGASSLKKSELPETDGCVKPVHGHCVQKSPQKFQASDATPSLTKLQFPASVNSPLPLFSSLDEQSIRKSADDYLASHGALHLNKPDLSETVGDIKPIKISQNTHKASISLPLIRSVHDQSVPKLHGNILASHGASSLKKSELPETNGCVKPSHGHCVQKSPQKFQASDATPSLTMSQFPASVNSPLPLFSSLDEQSIRKSADDYLASHDALHINKPDSSETVGDIKPIKISQNTHKVSISLPLIISVHDQSVHKLHGDILASLGASSLKKSELPETDGCVKPIHGHCVHKSPQKFQATDATSSLIKSQFPESVNSPLPLFSTLHEKSIQESAEDYLALDGALHLNKPDSSKTVGDIDPIKISHNTHKASISLRTFSSLDCLPKTVEFLKPFSQDGHNVSCSLPSMHSLHDQPAKTTWMKMPVGSPLPKTKLISVETIRKSQEITESTGNSNPVRIFQEEKERVSHVGSLKSIEISQNTLVESNPLPLFSSLHNQSVQKSAENCLGSDGDSSLNKPDSSETVGAIKMSQDSHKATSSSSLMNVVHGKNLVCSARWQPKRKKDMGTLGTICCPKTAPILPSPSLPCLEGLIISPVPDQSAQSSPMRRQPSDTLFSNSLPKTVKLLKTVSQDGCKVSSSSPLVCSFHDQPAEKSRTKQPAVSPFPKTKMVWVKSARKPQEITGASGITEPVKISLEEKERVSRASEIIMELRVQDTQESIKSFEKGSLNPLPSKKIWVTKSPETLQSTEVKNPISMSFNKEPHSRETITQLHDMQIDSDIDEELIEFPRTTKKYKLPVYPIPEHLKGLIENDMVPEVLRKPLTLETYTDYFAALLYAEDFYHEKWADYLLEGVTLQLHEQKAKKKSDDNNVSNKSHMDEDTKLFVKFEIDSVPERRPYLLSRDFVFLRHAGKDSTIFEGRFCRVMKSTHALAEFGDDFYSQYSPDHKYDVSFSFNRVCLKRSHQAVASAVDPSFLHILFPGKVFPASRFSSRHHNSGDRMSSDSVVQRLTTMQGHSPYLVTGPPTRHFPMMRDIVTKSALQIYTDSPSSRILICAQRNRTCDALAADLNEEIPDSELFRANAAFRELFDVDEEVIPLCSYDGECFITPSLCELQNFRVVTSTFVSSFRLHSCGVNAGHFTHIFLVDASSATEPESMIPLANLVGERTTVVILGCPWDRPEWVRSNIARENGLKRSYFQRLLGSEPYRSNDPLFVAHLDCSEWEGCDDLRYNLRNAISECYR